MKTLFLMITAIMTLSGLAQTEKPTCAGLPMAKPQVKAAISVEELTRSLENGLSEKLKKGRHSAVYKLFVDCNGEVTQTMYQRGTFSAEDQAAYQSKIAELKWTPAQHNGKPVISVVFVTLEIVNGKVTVVIQ